ncbi:DUF6686 family protein [Mucilaginibacter auburnensis]|uniref:Uncharacterized protein n=1 Tax=Mucilaginibacter auburnensis TaxID=1457233 RepID=A0A2H9VTY4_9SPHI|nr:DUF6686 family protein [Mucilaginibacter auburnensis]PJJ84262.1 hypothetical protein CLV57_1272 [Mucilaginibacter auburnensis]
MCENIILSKTGAATISQCMECKVLTLWMRTLLLNFSPEQFKSFKNFTSKLEVDQSLFPFPDGEERLVLRTPHNDICMAFSIDDWEQFQGAMDEAEYMMQVYDMMS